MDKFFYQRSSSELLGKYNNGKFNPHTRPTTSAETEETCFVGNMSLSSLNAKCCVSPFISTLELDDTVASPVCGVNIPEILIQKQLDSCLSHQEKKP